MRTWTITLTKGNNTVDFNVTGNIKQFIGYCENYKTSKNCFNTLEINNAKFKFADDVNVRIREIE